MPYSMSPIRMVSQSMVYYTISGLVDSMFVPDLISYDNVKAAYPESPNKLVSPTVIVHVQRLSDYDFQLGDNSSFERDFEITAFVTGDGFRDDIGQSLFDYFREAEIDLKNYNEGFPPPFGTDAEPSTIGLIEVQKGIRMFPIYLSGVNQNIISQPLIRHMIRIQGVILVTYSI